MPSISHILLATDFSVSVQAATELALEFAQKFAAKLTFLHVFDAPSYVGAFGDIYYAVPAQLGDQVRSDAQKALDKLAQRAAEAGLVAATLVLEGPPDAAILTAAQSQGIDLIVLGTHGRTGLKHLMLGSVAEDVVRAAPCAVLTVRNPEAAAAT